MNVSRFAAAVATTLVMSGCQDPVAPLNIVSSSSPDNFSFSIPQAVGASTTRNDNWETTLSTFKVTQDAYVTSGTATVTVTDAAGVQVYSGNLGTVGTFQTSAGTPGTWKVRVVLSNLTGNLTFSLTPP